MFVFYLFLLFVFDFDCLWNIDLGGNGRCYFCECGFGYGYSCFVDCYFV